MIFTDRQQTHYRQTFIDECRQKAWGALCHSEWIAKDLDEQVARFQRMQEEDQKLEAEMKAGEHAIDFHTVDNRNKRKAIQERRNQLAQEMKALGENVGRGQQSIAQLCQSADKNLALAGYAETWIWKEAEAQPEAGQSETG